MSAYQNKIEQLIGRPMAAPVAIDWDNYASAHFASPNYRYAQSAMADWVDGEPFGQAEYYYWQEVIRTERIAFNAWVPGHMARVRAAIAAGLPEHRAWAMSDREIRQFMEGHDALHKPFLPS